ncbi:hypothetical protein RJ40_01545 [Methanofollis aquaemaris]|uniref:Invertebrate defensins family profile domain-containing protein n=1 Tax=Methanofollis aquaemaris TaxID=126734 RepID=A0A8A3S887_9EURY|nr:hypothetical protein RJ40_01545 [Methanofollis aquaemaris]
MSLPLRQSRCARHCASRTRRRRGTSSPT